MSREEKRLKFHEAVLNMLYPPPPPQPKDEDLVVNNVRERFDAGLVPDDFGEMSSSTSSDDGDGGESWSQKLTRAQRKRLRKRKIKIEASRRGQIIGPLLPPPSDGNDKTGGGGGNDAIENGSPTVRRNAAEEFAAMTDDLGEAGSCANNSKVKQRRIAKKLARKSLLASEKENCDQDQSFKSSNQHNSGQV